MTRAKQVSLFLGLTACLLIPLGGAASDSGSCVVQMNATLDNAVLIDNNGNEVAVTPTPAFPAPLVFVGDEGELKAVISITFGAAPNPPFQSVRVSLSNISFTMLLPGGLTTVAGNPASLVDLVIPMDEQDENDGEEETTPGQPTSLELQFDASDGLQPDSSGCFTGNFVAEPADAFEAQLEDDNNEQEQLELSGTVVSVDTGTNTFVLDVNGVQQTITVNASTLFKGVAGLSGLNPGDLVKAEVTVQFDGTNLASEVELLFDEEDDNGVTGRIAGVDPTSGAATSVQMVFAPSAEDRDFPTVTVQVNIIGSTTFKVNKGNLDTTGFTFDASNLAVGQRLTAAGTAASGGGGAALGAGKVILKLQAVDGLLVNGSLDTGAGTFQLTVSSATGLVLGGPLTVRADSRTRFSGGLHSLSDLNTTDTYEVKGLLLRNGSDATQVIFLAKSVKKRRVAAAL